MSLGGRHGHTIRRLRRRMDAVLEEDRERRRPAPPPISEEHAAIRERIKRMEAASNEQVAQFLDVDLEEASEQDYTFALHEAVGANPELGNDAAELIVLMREEAAFLASQGVDPRPYARY